MQKKLKEMFSDDKVLAFLAIGCAAVFFINMLDKFFAGLYSYIPADLAFILCVVFLYAAYRKHNKNAQKGLLGAILMWYLYDEISYVVQGIVMNDDVFNEYANPAGITYLILSLVTFILYVILFVNYFIISGDHRSRPAGVFMNQIIVVLIALISLASIAAQVPVLNGIFNKLEAVTWHIGLGFLVLMLASYETHFDMFKMNRENAPVTEE